MIWQSNLVIWANPMSQNETVGETLGRRPIPMFTTGDSGRRLSAISRQLLALGKFSGDA